MQQKQSAFLQVEGRGHISAGRCCAGCLGEGRLVPFPAEPACYFSIVEANHCNAHILPGWHPLARARTISAGSTSLIPACFCCCPYAQVTPGVAAVRREGPFSLKSDNILPAPLMENLQYYHKTRDIRHRSPTGTKNWKYRWFRSFIYFSLSMYCFSAMPVLPWEH